MILIVFLFLYISLAAPLVTITSFLLKNSSEVSENNFSPLNKVSLILFWPFYIWFEVTLKFLKPVVLKFFMKRQNINVGDLIEFQKYDFHQDKDVTIKDTVESIDYKTGFYYISKTKLKYNIRMVYFLEAKKCVESIVNTELEDVIN